MEEQKKIKRRAIKEQVYENLQGMLKPVLAQCVAKYNGSEAKKEKQALVEMKSNTFKT